MSNIPNSLNQLITSVLPVPQPQTKRAGNFFEALSLAWQSALDRQADRVTDQAAIVSEGGDKLSDITALTAEASKLSFMANSSSTSLGEGSKSLETLARKA